MPRSSGLVVSDPMPRSTSRRSPSMTKISVSESAALIWKLSLPVAASLEGDIDRPSVHFECLRLQPERLNLRQVDSTAQLRLPQRWHAIGCGRNGEFVVQNLYLLPCGSGRKLDRDRVLGPRYL